MEKNLHRFTDMAVCQNLVPLVNIKIAGKWMFIPPKMVLIGIDSYPHLKAQSTHINTIRRQGAMPELSSVCTHPARSPQR